jgi:hypothetical protein
MTRLHVSSVVLLWLWLGTSSAAQHVHPSSDRLGKVDFASGCSAEAQPTFERGVQLLHSFEFGPAIAAFEATLRTDAGCALAHWGIALSRWGNPFGVGLRPAAQLQKGWDAVQRGRAAPVGQSRARAWLDAVAQLYDGLDARPQPVRLAAYRDAMARVAQQRPDDVEAAVFHALALTAAEDPADKTYAGRLAAVAILEPLFARLPDHPGLAHYLIHSYDVPALAPRALAAARRYAAIAPAAPHALHMPSHTFTRVGDWQASIDTNVASARTAAAANSTAEELHASDYQMYAYLQTAQDAEAARLIAALPAIAERLPGSVQGAAPLSAAFYAMAAMPARYALERGAWAEAARLEVRPSAWPYVDALTAQARAIGAARAGEMSTARAALAQLAALYDAQAATQEPYWTEQIRIQRETAAAWVAFAEGKREQAVRQLRDAAAAEDRTEKAAVTPGPLAPAREQLGDMLLLIGDGRAALEAFEATLTREPNRYRALAGAARAAQLAGDVARSRTLQQQLIDMCPRASGDRRQELSPR